MWRGMKYRDIIADVFERLALRDRGRVIWLIMQINYALPASKFERIPRFERAAATAVVIKELPREKRSPETHLAEREVGMRSNEWLLPRVLNYC